MTNYEQEHQDVPLLGMTPSEHYQRLGQRLRRSLIPCTSCATPLAQGDRHQLDTDIRMLEQLYLLQRNALHQRRRNKRHTLAVAVSPATSWSSRLQRLFGQRQQRHKSTLDLKADTSPTDLYRAHLSHPASLVMPPRILIAAELALPQCTKYRIKQKKELFALLGIECTIIPWGQSDAVRSALHTHTIAIFYRVPGYPETLATIQEAQRLGVHTLWEVDDLIFSRHLYQHNNNIKHLPRATQRSLLTGADLYLSALRMCGSAIASTPVLAQEMKAHGASEVFIVENALDASTLATANTIQSGAEFRKEDDTVAIVYGSGTDSHNVDFEHAAPALARLMSLHQHVVLHLIGPVSLPSALNAFASRVRFHPFSDYANYLRTLAGFDISVAPLEPSVFNDAKSNIKYLEASILGIPSVVSPRSAFASVVENGINGYLAETEEDWYRALCKLTLSATHRLEVGAAAHAKVSQVYSPDRVAHTQVMKLVGRFGQPSASMRVLLANIFFSPQSFGGATIVAEECAERIASTGHTAVAVFTSLADNEAPDYALRRYETKNTTCYAIKLPQNRSETMDYCNPSIHLPFLEVLKAFRPDVVHLHSVQGLSAHLADVCRDLGLPYVISLHDAWWLCERQFMVRADGRYCNQHTIDPTVCASCVENAYRAKQRTDYLRRILLGADLLIAPSNFQRDLYLANGVNPTKLRVIENGVRVPTTPARHRTNGPLRFAFVGGLGPMKGSDLIFDAFRSIDRNDYELILVDNTLNLGFASIDTRSCWVPGVVRVVPAYTQLTIDSFFSEVDVLLFPSGTKESFGLTVREALARDVWVIATAAGGVEDAIVNGINGTMIPFSRDPSFLRAAILELLKNRDKLFEYRNPLRSRLTSLDTQARQIYEALREVSETSRKQRPRHA